MVAPALAAIGRVVASGTARSFLRGGGEDAPVLGITAFNDAQVRTLLRQLGPGNGRTRRAVVQGINEGARQVRTFARSEVKNTLNLPARRINKGVALSPFNQAKVSQTTPTATITSDDDYISLTTFGARRFGGKKKKNQRVEVTVFKGRGRKKLSNRAFISRRKDGTGGAQVFIRQKGAKRTPIRRMWGPRIGYVMDHPDTIRRMNRKADDVVPRVLERRLRFELQRAQDFAAGRR